MASACQARGSYSVQIKVAYRGVSLLMICFLLGLLSLTHASCCLQAHCYRNTVRFTDASKAIPVNATLLEIGPHSVLRSPLRQSRPDLPYVGVMKKGEDGNQSLATAVGDMWCQGVVVKWGTSPVPTNTAGTECMPLTAVPTVPKSLPRCLAVRDCLTHSTT